MGLRSNEATTHWLSVFFVTKCFSPSPPFFFFFWLHHTACRIIAPQPGTEPGPLAVRLQSPNHWTTREFPI